MKHTHRKNCIQTKPIQRIKQNLAFQVHKREKERELSGLSILKILKILQPVLQKVSFPYF